MPELLMLIILPAQNLSYAFRYAGHRCCRYIYISGIAGDNEPHELMMLPCLLNL